LTFFLSRAPSFFRDTLISLDLGFFFSPFDGCPSSAISSLSSELVLGVFLCLSASPWLSCSYGETGNPRPPHSPLFRQLVIYAAGFLVPHSRVATLRTSSYDAVLDHLFPNWLFHFPESFLDLPSMPPLISSFLNTIHLRSDGLMISKSTDIAILLPFSPCPSVVSARAFENLKDVDF